MTDIVDYANLRSIFVQYKDGTTKTFTGSAIKTVSSDIVNEASSKSPLKDFIPQYENDLED